MAPREYGIYRQALAVTGTFPALSTHSAFIVMLANQKH
jgi:hypothetical protein